VLLVVVRKDIKRKKPLSGIVIFALAMSALSCFVAFAEVYVSLSTTDYAGLYTRINAVSPAKTLTTRTAVDAPT
jgi:hypothetical protein